MFEWCYQKRVENWDIDRTDFTKKGIVDNIHNKQRAILVDP